MKSGKRVNSASGDIWLTRNEIADLFGVFVSAIGANIRSIFKNEVLDDRRVRRIVRHRNGNETTLYNLEMITALAFRLKSRNAELFRQWIVRQAVSSPLPVVFWKIPNVGTMAN